MRTRITPNTETFYAVVVGHNIYSFAIVSNYTMFSADIMALEFKPWSEQNGLILFRNFSIKEVFSVEITETLFVFFWS